VWLKFLRLGDQGIVRCSCKLIAVAVLNQIKEAEKAGKIVHHLASRAEHSRVALPNSIGIFF
jgi:hypothetical protein